MDRRIKEILGTMGKMLDVLNDELLRMRGSDQFLPSEEDADMIQKVHDSCLHCFQNIQMIRLQVDKRLRKGDDYLC